MTGLALHPHAGFGLVRSRPVFLDLMRDRYFALDPASESAFLSLARGQPIDSKDKGRLLATGLFQPSDERQPPVPATIVRPAASLLDQSRAAPDYVLAAMTFVRTRLVHRRLAREPILKVLERKETERSGSAAELDERCRRFLAARSLAPVAPKCLPDSVVLRDWLGRAGHRPALVFGVRLDPFGAHCWLQSGALVLNDAVDRIAAFTPVLVLD